MTSPKNSDLCYPVPPTVQPSVGSSEWCAHSLAKCTCVACAVAALMGAQPRLQIAEQYRQAHGCPDELVCLLQHHCGGSHGRMT